MRTESSSSRRSRRSIARHLILAAALLGGWAAQAQQPPRGRIEGEITDSVHARKLAGAMVMISRVSPAGQFVTTISDGKGRFRFDTLRAGRYELTFVVPFLDSLDIVLPPRELVLAEDERVRVDLATPSGSTLRAAACPGVTLEPGRGAVIGEVMDAATDAPIRGARVAFEWSDLTFNRELMRAETTRHTGAVAIDPLGQFRLCGVPTATQLYLQVQTDKVAGSAVETIVDDSLGFIWRPLSLSVADARRLSDTAAVTGADTLHPRPLTGTATLSGRVRGQGGRPLAGVHVRVVDAAGAAVTDSLGRFELHSLPAGSQMAEARKLGYSEGRAQVELRSGRAVTWELELSRFVSLDSVRILAQRLRYRDFESRRRSGGWGKYLDEEQIARRNAFDTSDLLNTTPGMRVVGSGYDAVLVSTRGASSLFNSGCTVNVIIDGMQHMDINMISPRDIGAMEIYPSAVGVPPQYASFSNCGAVIIWTKR
jgi:hypothetical protein